MQGMQPKYAKSSVIGSFHLKQVFITVLVTLKWTQWRATRKTEVMLKLATQSKKRLV